MANKNSVSDWDVTPINNDNVGGVDISEGCAPSGINNALRALMGQVKAFHTGVLEMETELVTELAEKASPADIQTAIDALLGAAPAQLDTLVELAAALGNDGNYAATTTAALAARLRKDQNLADLPNVATARANLGLARALPVTTGAATVDFNTLVTPGWQPGLYLGTGANGWGSGDYGYVLVLEYGTSELTQVSFPYASGAKTMRFRGRYTGVWDPIWTEFSTGKETTSTAGPSGGNNGDKWMQVTL